MRPLERDDISSVSEIYSHAVTNRHTAHLIPPSIDYWEQWISSHMERFPAFTLLNRDVVAGFGSLSPYREGRQALEEVAEISYYLHPDHQRIGGGTYLITEMLQQASQIGFRHLLAILPGWNTGSMRLLENAKFEKWGELPGIARFGSQFTSHIYYGRHL